MGEAANVRDLSVFSAIRAQLIRFSHETQEVLMAAQVETERTLETLTSLLRQCQLRVRSAREQLNEAQEAYRNAGEEEDLEYYEDAICEARHRLAEAERELMIVSEELQRLRQVAEPFAQQRHRFLQFLENDCPYAENLLAQKAGHLHTYAEAQFPDAAAAPALSPGGTHPNPDGVAVAASPQRWVERGIVEVRLDLVDVSDSWVHGPEDFHKVTPEEMRRGVQLLRDVVLPAVRNGADRDYFSRLDQMAGVEYSEGLLRVYEAFWGSEPIRLSRVGDRYEVTGGYHRLRLARELGLEFIPASVVERAH